MKTEITANILTLNELKKAAIQKNQMKKIDINKCQYEGKQFVLHCYAFLNPQAYGSQIQKRFINVNNLQHVPSTVGRGDCIENSSFKEIKSSISAEGEFSIVQIRPHHNLKSYLLLFFKICDDGEVENYFFDVPSDILYSMKLSNAHGKKESKNLEKEYRMTVKIGDENWNKFLDFRVERNF